MQSHLGALTVLLLALFFSSTQKVWGQKFSLGLKAGPSVTFGRFRDTDLRNTYSVSPKVGFTAGGLIIFPLKKKYSFISEFAYSQKGKKLLFNDNTWTNNATFKFIDLSMALRKSYEFRLRRNVKSNLVFNVGPSIEYWLNGKGEVQASGPSAQYKIVFNQQAEGGNFDVDYYNNVPLVVWH